MNQSSVASSSPAIDVTTATVWSALGALIDRGQSVSALAGHRLAPLAAQHWREVGRTVPGSLVASELRSIARCEVAKRVLGAVSDALDQDVIALKGLAVAELYGAPYLRPFGDLDLLVADAPAAQRRLLEAGFRVASVQQTEEFFKDHRHERPLEWPGMESMRVEIHSRPPWVHWCEPPSFAALASAAAPSPWPRIRFAAPAQHAVILACHAWETLPLRMICDLLDVTLMRLSPGGEAADQVAEELGVERVWRSTRQAADALFLGADRPLSLRLWGRDLLEVRERSLAEHHLRRLLGPFWERPPLAASADALAALAFVVLPVGGETWPEKLDRARRGIAHPLRPITAHDRALGPAGERLRPPRRGPRVGQDRSHR